RATRRRKNRHAGRGRRSGRGQNRRAARPRCRGRAGAAAARARHGVRARNAAVRQGVSRRGAPQTARDPAMNEASADSRGTDSQAEALLYRLLRRAIEVRPAEVAALGWSWLYIFAVLSSYYIMRPIRDQMGIAGGVDKLQWL